VAARKYFVGDVFTTNGGSKAVITDVNTGKKQYVKIKWLDEFEHEMLVCSTNLSNGSVQNPYEKTISNVGYLGAGYNKTGGRKQTLEYATWYSMFNRSYSEAYQTKKPTYDECEVSSEWHCFDDFLRWTETAIGWGLDSYQMDKDLLHKGNKEYCPEFCVMLPRKLNMLIVNRVGGRGEYPIGVHKEAKRNQYTAQFKEFDGAKKLKRFWTVEEAFNYYKTNKERVVKEAAEIYKDQIDPRAYQALMSWEILIDD
jgi:hypothetical protein